MTPKRLGSCLRHHVFLYRDVNTLELKTIMRDLFGNVITENFPYSQILLSERSSDRKPPWSSTEWQVQGRAFLNLSRPPTRRCTTTTNLRISFNSLQKR